MKHVLYVAPLCVLGLMVLGSFYCGGSNPYPTEDVSILENITFSDVKVITDMRCSTRCHDWLATYEAVMDYVEPNNAEESLLFQMVQWDYMPKTGDLLTNEEKQVIYSWIMTGANK
jgi:alpha-glucuronidase